MGIEGTVWAHAPLWAGVASLVAAAAMFVAFKNAARMGAASRERIRAKFAKAARENPFKIWIGFVQWTIAQDEFRPVVSSTPDRGLIYSSDRNRSIRVSREIQTAQDRRYFFYFSLGGMAFWSLPALAVLQSLLFALPLGAFALWFLVVELAYRFGFQPMDGAMVLDPDLLSARRKDVHAQKVHGDGRFATEDEALATSFAARSSPIHQQEF